MSERYIPNVLISIAFFLVCFAVTPGIFAQFNQPESVIWDASNERYIVSNMGNGRLLEMDEEGETDAWVTAGLNRPRGMTILDGILYVTDFTFVRGYNLNVGNQVFNVMIDSAIAMNDLENDGTYLYASDSNRNKIFKIDVEEESYEEYVTTGLNVPNGLLYDQNLNRILICSYRVNSPIQAVSLNTGTLSTVVNTTLDELDGLAVDGRGRIYVSSWSTGSVYRFDRFFRDDPEEVSTGHRGPADIFVNTESNFLVVPNYQSNSVSFVDLTLYSHIVLPDSSHDFGGQILSSISVWRMQVQNIGDTTLVISSGEINPPYSFFAPREFRPMSIQPGITDTIAIAFSPDSIQFFPDTVWLTTNDQLRETVGIPVNGHGFPNQPIVVPDTLDFGARTIGDSARIQFQIRNTALRDVLIRSIQFGAGDTVFYANNLPDSIEVGAMQEFTLQIIFIPSDARQYSRELIFDVPAAVHDETIMIMKGEGIESAVRNGNDLELPSKLTINNIYPNPFNSSVNIQFGVPNNSLVRISLYNLLGQEVYANVNRFYLAGYHSVHINANTLPSGSYLINLETDANKNISKKIILLK
ncbi:T9SS type A sorting domain-containing protein [Calditrichota bacterium]